MTCFNTILTTMTTQTELASSWPAILAIWLGILTSISPCPLATNIAAISFISKNLNSTRSTLLSGLLYTLGRMAAYLALGIIIIKSTNSIPLAIKNNSPVSYPLLYGVGTALPVIAFSILLAIGTQSVSKAFNTISKIEFWTRRITGLIFILVGIYYCFTYLLAIG